MLSVYGKLEYWVGAALLAVITGLVFIAAVMRFFGQPLIWSVDLAQLLFIWLCFIGACKAMRERAHLGVDLIVRMLPHAGRLWVETALAIVTIVFLGALIWKGVELTLLNIERQFGDSGLSYGWVTVAVPVGSALLILSVVANLTDAWSGRGRLVFTRATEATGEPARSEL
jgi:TRAP-type C4-dicarboxylate transport system permease small subunit